MSRSGLSARSPTCIVVPEIQLTGAVKYLFSVFFKHSTGQSAASLPITSMLHAQRHYANGEVYSRSAEDFFSILEGGVIGTYRH